jgi:glycosyltransferase involved in cell wall biosynthesis
MDIEPLTGGCHFNNGCERFQSLCGNCPQLVKSNYNDISKRILKQKKNDFKDIPITLVAVSSWIYNWIKKSSLFRTNRTENILLGVDHTIFKKIDKVVARSLLDLPVEKNLILFGCFNLNDKRKGGNYLLDALKIMHEDVNTKIDINNDSIILVTIGDVQRFDTSQLSFEHINLGLINDDRILSLVYNAMDVVAVPSIDDVGPLIVNEVIMCETPVIAFNIGIAPDIIQNERFGYLAENFNAKDFSKGLLKLLFEKSYENNSFGNMQKKLSLDNQSKSYIKLFEDLLSH